MCERNVAQESNLWTVLSVNENALMKLLQNGIFCNKLSRITLISLGWLLEKEGILHREDWSIAKYNILQRFIKTIVYILCKIYSPFTVNTIHMKLFFDSL